MKHSEYVNDAYDNIAIASDTAIVRSQVARLLRHQIELFKRHPESGEQLAYEIAGLLALNSIRRLTRDDPLLRAIEVAVQLELPLRHRARGASWEQLEELLPVAPA